MQFSSATFAAFLLAVSGAAAFSRPAFVPKGAVIQSSITTSQGIQSPSQTGCSCPSCVASHPSSCGCGKCRKGVSQLFSTAEAETEEVPAEVEAMDGIESKEEAHNVDRPARGSLKKKSPPKGKSLDEFEVGSTIQGKVKTITSYGAFVDIGAQTDGLLHISQLSKGFVSDVKEFCEVGQELDVRIVSIDKGKSQVALSLMTEEEASQQAQGGRRQPRQQQSNRRDDSAAVASLNNAGWDATKFVEGTVVSTVDFGAFVRVDVSQLNGEAEGEMDGLVHISALTAGRASSVTSIVNVDDKVQVRVKSIDGKKVSLSMITPEDEAEKGGPRGGGDAPIEGAADWKESLEKIQSSLPQFENRPMVVDLRK